MKPFLVRPALALLIAAAAQPARAQVIWTEGIPGAPPGIAVGAPVYGQGYAGYRIMPGVVMPNSAENRPWLQLMPYSPYFYPAQIGENGKGGVVNMPTIDPRFWAGGMYSPYYPPYPPYYQAAYPGNVPPIFHWPGTYQQQMANLEAVLRRTQALGNIGPNTARIADALDKGVAKVVATDGKGPDGIRLAGIDGKQQPVAQTPPPNGNGADADGFKQTIDEINKLFRTEAELLRSIDIGSLRRGYGPYGAGSPYGYPSGYGYGYAPGAPAPSVYDGSTVVMNGRTGLELVLIAPEVLDALKLPRNETMLVKEVYPKTPAEAAGFKKGDILLEFNGKKVPADFQAFVTKIMPTVKPDIPVNSVVLRGKERIEISGMVVTEKRVLPPLPHERLPEIASVIQTVPGINTENPNAAVTPSTNRVPELRIIRNGLTTEIIRVDPYQK
jgi:hypothetical protein